MNTLTRPRIVGLRLGWAAGLLATVAATLTFVTAPAIAAAPSPHATLAGLTDGSVYMAGQDGQWHWISTSAVFASLGLDPATITWYDELPGDVGDPYTTVSRSVFAAPEQAAPLGLAALLNGSLFVAGDDGLWHPVTPARFAALGFDRTAVIWYGELPGDVGDPF
jgi:hypothetical protein